MTPQEEYERGLHVGRVYAEEDRAAQTGTGAFEIELREQAHRAVEDALRGTPSQRCWAAYELGVVRGYREEVREPKVAVMVISDQGVQPGVLTADARGDVIRPFGPLGTSMPFACEPDESGGYDLDDPKHETYHERMADIADLD